MTDVYEDSIRLHGELHGKIEIRSKRPIRDRNDLSLVYTPGVAAVSKLVAADKAKTPEYTIKGNLVAVISDGSAVLGLGNIGPEGALPVMEGKAALFKELAGVDAFPIVLSTQDTDEIVRAVTAIAPTFGGINLEDISAPRCFEIERRLKETLPIPVMHDDQHGTAIVVLAGLMNAMKVVGKRLTDSKVTVVGAGAAGNAVAKLLILAGVGDVVVLDSKGIVSSSREDLDPWKRELAGMTNRRGLSGGMSEAMAGADAVVGVSGPGTILPEHVRAMAENPIVFALANPTPEIMPEDAKSAGASVIATGRSDLPNQTNNALGFPGIFRGALDNGVREISDAMKLAAAEELAATVPNPTADRILPTVFEAEVVKAVSSAIR